MKKVYLFSFILFLIDLIVKIIVKNTLILYQSVVVIPNFFNITYVINTGAAFSILEGMQWLLIVLGIFFIFFMLKFIKKDKLNNYKIIIYSLIIGGIIGNLYDRIIYNGVVDFFDFSIFNYQAPIFNTADIFIVIGTILIILEGGIYGNRSIRKGKEN